MNQGGSREGAWPKEETIKRSNTLLGNEAKTLVAGSAGYNSSDKIDHINLIVYFEILG